MKMVRKGLTLSNREGEKGKHKQDSIKKMVVKAGLKGKGRSSAVRNEVSTKSKIGWGKGFRTEKSSHSRPVGKGLDIARITSTQRVRVGKGKENGKQNFKKNTRKRTREGEAGRRIGFKIRYFDAV